MVTYDRRRWQAAVRIRSALKAACSDRVSLPAAAWETLLQLTRRHQRAVERGWRVAAQTLQRDLERRLRWFENDLAALRLSLVEDEPPVVALRTVYEELSSLADEFAEVEIDLRATTVRVQTTEIVLDDLDLGPFNLVWNWIRLPYATALTVDALEPVRPAARDDVTHPHVMNGQLCEGEATRPLAQALRDGRLCDYFLIVRQTLQTYNSSSAYVALEDWMGSRCRSCDDRVSDDDLTSCESCGDELCQDCSRSCCQCGRTGCSDCLRNCGDCLEDFCGRCWPSRSGRDATVCPNCQASGTETESTEPLEETRNAEDEIATAPETRVRHNRDADDSIHADRLGEVALAAGPR